ncbi:MAG TPA: right-handed parallel beta-helix repeat-containing protein [Pseudomonadales bacterium]|nr:right-handed parallel beta-helix repeat-containing protein [Pseudomonadales bacterium]
MRKVIDLGAQAALLLAAALLPSAGWAATLVQTKVAISAYKGTTKIGTGFATEASCEAFLETQPAMATNYKCRKDATYTLKADPAPTPVDVCPNIAGDQAAVPAGMVKDASGNCVSAPPPPAPPPTLPPGVTVATALPAGYVQCGAENYSAPQTCTSTGPVYYGAGSKWHVRAGPVQCNNIAFGDPVDGMLKTCHQAGSVTPPPPPVEPPPATGDAGPRVTTFTASGPITAVAGQVIAGVRITNSSGPCITINVPNVTVRDSDIGPCEGEANILVGGSAKNTRIEHNSIHDGARGVLASQVDYVDVVKNKFNQFHGPKYKGTAIECDYTNFCTMDGNVVTGRAYASDAVSMYESSNAKIINNTIDIDMAEPSGAAFTMGDSTTGKPGSNNYVAGNVVRQTGGVPAGVFGSNGNTVLEKNCLTAGIQAYNYSGVFVGVTVRNNVIGPGSFVPDTSVIAGWSTNIMGTDCSRVGL